MKLTHKAYLHLENIYHSPYVLEYWGMKRGLPLLPNSIVKVSGEKIR